MGEFKARVLSRMQRARQEGFARTALELSGRVAAALLGLVLLPLSVAGHALGYRRITFLTQHVGHLAIEPDSFLKSHALGELPELKWFFLAPAQQVSNAHLLSYWKRWLPAVSSPAACFLLRAMSSLGLMRHDAGRFVLRLNASQDSYRLNAAWSPRPPWLSLDREDRDWSERVIRQIGLPAGVWFACVHVREGEHSSHSYRNGSVQALLPALEEIVRRGGWCVRMGDTTATRLPAMAGVIDYAHHPLRSARLDVCLCAQARFFLGNSSGIALVSSVFGVPSALANMAPLSCLGMHPSDLSMPKLHSRGGKLLRFDEVFGTPVANYRFASEYARDGIELIENTAGEILAMVREMLDRTAGGYLSVDEDESRQTRFKALLRAGDYGYYATSRVAVDFLRRHAALMD